VLSDTFALPPSLITLYLKDSSLHIVGVGLDIGVGVGVVNGSQGWSVGFGWGVIDWLGSTDNVGDTGSVGSTIGVEMGVPPRPMSFSKRSINHFIKSSNCWSNPFVFFLLFLWDDSSSLAEFIDAAVPEVTQGLREGAGLVFGV